MRTGQRLKRPKHFMAKEYSLMEENSLLIEESCMSHNTPATFAKSSKKTNVK